MIEVRETPEQIAAGIVTRAETDALQNRVGDEGFASIGDMFYAAERNLSAGEYYNNAVMTTPGIEDATPVAQGGNLIADGLASGVVKTRPCKLI